jgi:murein L,D-transpeptidase YcbB/YkuD
MKPRLLHIAARALFGALLAVQIAAGQLGAPPAPAADTVKALVVQGTPALAPGMHPWDGSGWLERFYGARGDAPAWTGSRAHEALALLGSAADEGLNPADYGADQLRQALADPQTGAARFDVDLTTAMLHYLADLHFGRVRSDYQDDDSEQRNFDPAALLDSALSGDSRLDAAVAEPGFPPYGRVRAALSHYRELAGAPQPVLPEPAGHILPGGRYAGARSLGAMLVQLGDLDAQAPQPKNDVYSQTLAQGVRRFQDRHGLVADGALGPETIAALNVPLAQRARQLELTLERLRWLPDFAPGPVVLVNLPGYRLWAFDTTQPQERPLAMRVIVGAAAATPTPIFVGKMRSLEFNPYWNVPRSITLNEFIPKLERDPGYLSRSHMELVGADGVTAAVNHATLAELRAGTLRIRQRPGPKNSLGTLKFAMPNPMDIYLHATPHRELFQRTKRDLSHGCIRVERPAELARFVLNDPNQWDLDAIEDAMESGRRRVVSLASPVPVVIFYATAMVDSDGRVLFAHDVYGRDPTLESALAKHGTPQAQIVPASEARSE